MQCLFIGKVNQVMRDIPRAVLYIDLNILDENYKTIRAKVPPEVKILCVVKADAYGHGATDVARRLALHGADYFGVATVEEAVELRDSGITTPILVMSGIFPWDEIKPVLANNLTPVVYDFHTLHRIQEESAHFDSLLKIHIKIDTGMGRLGFHPDDMPSVIDHIKNTANVRVEGLMSHFASSENRDEHGINQITRFKKVLDLFKDNSIEPELAHMANSGVLTNYPEAYFNMVRVGINLYGSYSAKALRDKLVLKQVMKLTSKIALIREFPSGCSLSYGRTFTTTRKTKVAYIPLGYADGYPRTMSNKGRVLIRDTECSIVGRVCMDWLLVDVTDLGDVNAGEDVVLLGKSNTKVITADEIAELEGTIPYEILCKISKRVVREYVR